MKAYRAHVREKLRAKVGNHPNLEAKVDYAVVDDMTLDMVIAAIEGDDGAVKVLRLDDGRFRIVSQTMARTTWAGHRLECGRHHVREAGHLRRGGLRARFYSQWIRVW